MSITGNDLKGLFKALAQRMHDARGELSALDRAIGDGDHGVTMAVGWTAVSEAIELLEDPDIASVFHTAGTVFLRAVGATVGPLYATGLLDMAKWSRDRRKLDMADALSVFEVFIGGLIRRGHASVGQKTMMDTWIPAYEAFRNAWPGGVRGAAQAALQAADAGCVATANMLAQQGRAGRLGERSRGHLDPGARSAYLLLETTVHWLQSAPVPKTNFSFKK